MSAGMRTRAVVPILLSLAAVLTYHHHEQTMGPRLRERVRQHDLILDGKAESPYRFRLLVPHLTEALSTQIPADDRHTALLASYTIYVALSLAAVFLSLFGYLRRWFTAEQALIGTLFVAATMTVPLRDHFYQPWSFAETALFTIGLWLIHARRRWALLLLIAVATANRETALFLVVAFGAAHVRDGKDLGWVGWGAAYLAVWAAVYFTIRDHVGPGWTESLANIWEHNTAGPRLVRAAINVTLFMGAFWIFAALGYRHATSFMRRMLLVLPPYLLAVVLFGVWYEVRLLMPTYPILLPVGLAYLFRNARTPVQAASSSAGANTSSGL